LHTQAALRGIAGITAVPLTGSGCLNYLTAAGYIVKSVPAEVPLYRFVANADKSKVYLIATRGHAIALVRGTLIDTAPWKNKGPDKRIVLHAWEVSAP
jgi:hypothetical protein